MPSYVPRIDPDKPIPPFYSRYPKRSPEELQQLLRKSRETATTSTAVLRQAAEMAQLVVKDEAWMSKYSIKRPPMVSKRSAALSATAAITAANSLANLVPDTGGHSNKNHAVPWIIQENGKPDIESNRVRELLRNHSNRARMEQPESRTDERWDKPRVPGGRRRRIVRDRDAPEAPMEPYPSGYVAFVSLMTTKFRHDRGPDAEHSQSATLQEISRLWRVDLRTSEQEHYTKMAEDLRREYQEQMLEYRATDTFRTSKRFVKLGDGQGPWVHIKPKERSKLEAEVAGYDTVVFPPRPASKDEEYYKREKLSKEKRKEKLRLEAEQRRARKRALEEILQQQGKLARRLTRERTRNEDGNDDGNDDANIE
eukprot:scaffold2276_cov160-Amphora_coffeaeformis.AAC.13